MNNSYWLFNTRLSVLVGHAESRLVQAVLDLDALTIDLATATPTATCPLCASDARRVHSRYTRRLDDRPCLGRSVRLTSGDRLQIAGDGLPIGLDGAPPFVEEVL